MTLQYFYARSRSTALFDGTEVHGWRLSAEEHYLPDDPNRLIPTHFSLEIAVDAVPPLNSKQRARFERALQACPVLSSLKQEVVLSIV